MVVSIGLLLGMGQLLYRRAGAESRPTSENKITASRNYMLDMQCPTAHALIK